MVKRYGFKYVGGASTPGMEGGRDVFGEDEKYGVYVLASDYDAALIDACEENHKLRLRIAELEAALQTIVNTHRHKEVYISESRMALNMYETALAALPVETFDVTKEPSVAMKNEMREILGLEPLPDTQSDRASKP